LRPAPEWELGWLLGGRDGRLLLVAVGAVLGALVAALAPVTAASALLSSLRVDFLHRLAYWAQAPALRTGVRPASGGQLRGGQAAGALAAAP
jgi:hypothetical protein